MTPDGPLRFPPPPPPPRAVARPRLMSRLEAAADVPLVVVSGPAGSGKTRLLTQWAAHARVPVAWIDATDAHADPAVFLDDLVAALVELEPRLAEPLLVRQGEPGVPVSTGLLLALGRGLRSVTEPFAIVVDDAHVLTNRECVEPLEVVAANLAPGCRLVLGCRGLPSLRLAGLRARRLVVEIPADALALTRDEAAAVLTAEGVAVADDELDALMAATEGWAAGLVLGGMALRDAPDRQAALASLAREDARLTAYFSEQVLGRLGPAQADLMLRTAILDTLGADVCTAVLGTPVTADDLRGLERSHAFVMALDVSGERFRLHALLRDLLRGERARRDPDGERDGHRRAARWYLEAGDAPRAVEHLLAAGDADAAALTVWRAALRNQTNGRVATTREMLALFPPSEVRGRPALAVAAAWSALEGDSRRVEHWARCAEEALDGRIAGPADQELRTNLHLLRAAAGAHGVAAMRDEARAASRALPDASPWRALACLFEGVATHLLGDPVTARALLREGADRAGTATTSVGALCTTWLAVMSAMDGSWRAAAASAARARGLVDAAGLGGYSTMMILDALEALLAAREDRAADAGRLIVAAREKLSRTSEIAPWGQIVARLMLARAAVRIGQDTVGRTLAAEAERRRARIPDSPVLDREYAAFRDALGGLPAGALAGPGAVTTAELRVLRFMPTHLSYREVGERLHLSRFTVKSQALAVYRKLGVTTRADAVARAQALGLLDD